MKIRLGLSPESLEMSRERELVVATGLIPEKAMLSAFPAPAREIEVAPYGSLRVLR